MTYHHGVRNLSGPQWSNTLVKPSNTLSSHNLANTIERSLRERRHSSLHPDLHSLERTKSNIGQELCRSRTSQVYSRLILHSILLSSKIGVELLEEFIPAILQSSLNRVSEEGGRTTCVQSAKAFGTHDGTPTFDVAFVEFGIDLSAAFYEVERCYAPVG